MLGNDLWSHVVGPEESCGELFCAISRRINPQLRMTVAIANLGIVCECDHKTAGFPRLYGGTTGLEPVRPPPEWLGRFGFWKRGIFRKNESFPKIRTRSRLGHRQNKTCVPYSLLLMRENMAP